MIAFPFFYSLFFLELRISCSFFTCISLIICICFYYTAVQSMASQTNSINITKKLINARPIENLYAKKKKKQEEEEEEEGVGGVEREEGKKEGQSIPHTLYKNQL